MNNEFEMTLKRAAAAYFEVLSRYLPRETKENYKNPQDGRSPGRELNPVPPEYETEAE
jgi:hypothetical protein